MHSFSYEWYLKDGYPAKGIKYHGSKVFSCFAGGGGSSMGYKLAGYNVIGINEIDKKMLECYQKNHNVHYIFTNPIQQFANLKKYPDELYDFDILDGSPPCSSFSISGNREKDWGKKKKFTEGQKEQILDTLFFDFIKLGKRLQPKIILAENVIGLMIGNAVKYAAKIKSEFENAGYSINHVILDASKMGVPQQRKRVFFYAIRNDLLKYIATTGFFNMPYLNLKFDLPIIKFKEIYEKNAIEYLILRPCEIKRWNIRIYGDKSLADCDYRLRNKRSFFNQSFIYKNQILQTIKAEPFGCQILYDELRKLSKLELQRANTFPLDYDFLNHKYLYIIGMSVPPVMIAQIAHQIKKQWIDKFPKGQN